MLHQHGRADQEQADYHAIALLYIVTPVGLQVMLHDNTVSDPRHPAACHTDTACPAERRRSASRTSGQVQGGVRRCQGRHAGSCGTVQRRERHIRP